MKMKSLAAPALLLCCLTLRAGTFQSGHLAVLRAGDGELNPKLKQSPIFIDEFAPGQLNPAPLSSVAIPTNGPETLFFNGHAATEGLLARSADHHLLTFAGYGGVNLLEEKGTPSLLDIGRGFCTVDAAGKTHTLVYHAQDGSEKANPRGGVTDGTNNFWSCGNAFGTGFYNATVTKNPVSFSAVPNSRAIRIVNNVLYVTLNGPDGVAGDLSPGIYAFEDVTGSPSPLPHTSDTRLQLVVPAKAPYTKIAGFDMNPAGTIAYTADTDAGIQKYVKTEGAWKFACNFSIPQTIPDADNHEKGCFGVAVDFSGAAPIIYATTTEGYNGCANSNRVVQIVDTNAMATVVTVAQAPSEKMVYRGIDFTPEP